MSLQILRNEVNNLLGRREVVCRFDKSNGFLTRAAAEKAVAEAIKTEATKVFAISLRGEFGSMNLEGLFHIYDDEKLAQRRIPDYIMVRRLPREERKDARKKKLTEEKEKTQPEKAAPKSKGEK